MQKWNYATTILYANIDDKGVKEFLQGKYGDIKGLPQYSVKALEFTLQEYGKKGWELMHIEPVEDVSKDGFIGSPHGGPSVPVRTWSNAYFCVFKRPLEE